MKIAVINNYDSFVHNIIHYLESFDGVEVSVFLNDKFYLEQLQSFDKIVLSPGPGIPEEAGLLLDVIDFYKDKKSILGVCLGHQAIAEYFGCSLVNLNQPLHGIATKLHIIEDDFLWNDLHNDIFVGHYHSWSVSKNNLSTEIIVTAIDELGNIMALKHKKYDIRGVQFHPESVLTPQGKIIIENWLKSN
ncbi:anthranilate synthase component II [Paenimyroides viscosum]|uniref:Aminodeoxychorismate/anthranilate synthase component II n=1 Tax=Paenimyroides viscosum TaxID=2488729 RepID=A0A3P1AYH7_9FLAO|nr:aminodeoxychorismate/anthranilate synthase component II [Paenimyroides viscosum]RRA93991.1 aminodeoxychorismate/anthranilate synthase component II [Paenimyroides viscosum]